MGTYSSLRRGQEGEGTICFFEHFRQNIYTKKLFSMSVLFGPYQLLLTNQLEMEKMKVEQEKKKCYLAQEALKEKVLHEKTRLCSCVLLIFTPKNSYNYHIIQGPKITPSSYDNNCAKKSTHFKSLK